MSSLLIEHVKGYALHPGGEVFCSQAEESDEALKQYYEGLIQEERVVELDWVAKNELADVLWKKDSQGLYKPVTVEYNRIIDYLEWLTNCQVERKTRQIGKYWPNIQPETLNSGELLIIGKQKNDPEQLFWFDRDLSGRHFSLSRILVKPSRFPPVYDHEWNDLG
jgi:hypothetical protein